MVINDRVTGKHDILDCSKITLSTLEFKFHDIYENVCNLNGCHVSFSLVFTTVMEDRCMSIEFQRMFIEFQRMSMESKRMFYFPYRNKNL